MKNTIKQILTGTVYQGPRPGYNNVGLRYKNISRADMASDFNYIVSNFKSVFCLMTSYEIKEYYNFDLLEEYRSKGLHVISYPINDNKFMGASEEKKSSFFDFNNVFSLIDNAPKPLYIHCSAGVVRSRYLAEKLYQNTTILRKYIKETKYEIYRSI